MGPSGNCYGPQLFNSVEVITTLWQNAEFMTELFARLAAHRELAAAGGAALAAILRADESKYALRPADPHFLTSMAAAVSGAVDAGGGGRSYAQNSTRRWVES